MRLSLASWILIGLLLGVGFGLYAGESAGVLSVVGDAFIGLLQMTVLPYIAFAIIASIGKLSTDKVKQFGLYAGIFLLTSVTITLAAIILLPLCLPARESASFFSTSMLEDRAPVDFLNLFIPSNPFFALANNIVPAVVLFCIALGAAIMALKDKKVFLEQLDFLTTALARINHYMVKLTPIGVFAIVASMVGTTELEELIQIKAYIVLNLVASVVLGYGVLLVLLASITPFSYRELFSASRAPVLTALVTGKVLIVLPMIIEAAEGLFARHFSDHEEAASHVRAVTPLIYPFPHAGKLLALLFVPFAAWFVDIPISLEQYPALLGSGYFSLFGSPLVAMPFLLDMLQLPADMFHLFMVSGILTSRLGDMLGVIHLLFVSLLTAAALTHKLQFEFRRIVRAVALILAIVVVTGLGTRAYLSVSLETEYNKDEIIRNMHSSLHSVPDSARVLVHLSVPDDWGPLETSAMHRISTKGVLRVGYHPDNLPMTFFNSSEELVGYDVDMANALARQLGCRLEFVPFEFATLADQLRRGDFDVAMSGIAKLPGRLTQLTFAEPYMHVTAALVVKDHRRKEFMRRMDDLDFRETQIAVARSAEISKIAASLLPGAEFVQTTSLRKFCESDDPDIDAMVWTAESGAAWTLLYPEFCVVPIRPLYRVPVGWAVALGNHDLTGFLSQWLSIMQSTGADQRMYDHWILGKVPRRNR